MADYELPTPDYTRWSRKIYSQAVERDVDILDREEMREYSDEMAELLCLDKDDLWSYVRDVAGGFGFVKASELR